MIEGIPWMEIIPNLTRGVPKNFQKLMGKSWSIDELASKKQYGAISFVRRIAG